jgi:uncharacterized protein YceK
MKAISTFLLAVLTASGCASVHHIRDTGTGATYADINQRAEGRSATVTLTSGQKNRAQDLYLAPDSSTWLERASGQRLRFATAEIQQVQFRNRLSGAVTGLGIGAIAGAGFMTGAMRAGDYDWDASLIVGALASPFTGIIGALIGAAVSKRTVYRFPAKE